MERPAEEPEERLTEEPVERPAEEPEDRVTPDPAERLTPLEEDRTALPAEEDRATPVRPVEERREVAVPRDEVEMPDPPGRRVTAEPFPVRTERDRLPVLREAPPRETRPRELRLASRWPMVPAWLGRKWYRPPHPPGP